MDIPKLGEDRFLRKSPSQNDETKDAAYAALNPAPKRGDDSQRKIGRPKGSEEDDGAPNILTGTVITACFIQTSALPSRIELQGNDLTFFDDTYIRDATVQGDTSRLVFTHASAIVGGIVTQGFIWEKRGNRTNQYDNVLSLYGLPPKTGALNYLYFGFEGGGTNFQTNAIQFNVNHLSGDVSDDNANGIFAIGGSYDGVVREGPCFGVIHNSIVGISGDGYTVFLSGRGTSGVILVNSDIIPLVDAAYDIGSSGNRFKDIYISGSIIGPGAGNTPYAGFVNSTAGSNVLPTGWAAAKSAGNTYTITHNLGSVDYGFSFSLNTRSLVPVYQSVNTNTLEVEFQNSAGTAFATDFYFVLTPI